MTILNARRLLAAALLALVWPSVPAMGQAPPAIASPMDVVSQLGPGMTLARFQQQLRGAFASADADSDGRVTANDDTLHEMFLKAQFRNAGLMDFLQSDVNGHGTATEDEIRRNLRYQYRASLSTQGQAGTDGLERMVRERMAADANGDGRVTFAEALAHANNRIASAGNAFGGPATSQLRPLLAFDVNGDGVVTLAEVETAGEVLFRTVDTDGNGTISQEELTAYRRANP